MGRANTSRQPCCYDVFTCWCREAQITFEYRSLPLAIRAQIPIKHHTDVAYEKPPLARHTDRVAELWLSTGGSVRADGLLMARELQMFPEAMTTLQSAISARYKITRL